VNILSGCGPWWSLTNPHSSRGFVSTFTNEDDTGLESVTCTNGFVEGKFICIGSETVSVFNISERSCKGQ
jgi:hypothetical protein